MQVEHLNRSLLWYKFNPSIAHQHNRSSKYVFRLAVQDAKTIPRQSVRLATPQEPLSARSGSAEVIVIGKHSETFGYVIR